MGTRPGPPRLLVLLLAVAGAAAAQPRLVNGVVGGSALLSLDLPPNKTLKRIQWSFSNASGAKIQVTEFGPGGFERSDLQDRFRDRLEMHNMTDLRIWRLERGDSGDYEARLTLHPAMLEIQLFTLSVYDPLPEPKIQGERLSLSPRHCNLTLRCRLPPGSDAWVSWQRGQWGQLCGDDQTLCLALPAAAFDSVYTCVARNPAQERNVSVHLSALCRQQGTRGHVWCLVSVGAAALPGIGLAWFWRRRRRRRRRKAEGGALPSPSCQDPPPEPFYSQIQRGNSLELPESQDQPRSIYCELQAKV